MSFTYQPQGDDKMMSVDVDLGAGNATNDLLTAVGDVMVMDWDIMIDTAPGGIITSFLCVKTNDATPFNLLTSVEGVLASLVGGKHLDSASKGKSFKLRDGKKIQWQKSALSGSGTMKFTIVYKPLVEGAVLT